MSCLLIGLGVFVVLSLVAAAVSPSKKKPGPVEVLTAPEAESTENPRPSRGEREIVARYAGRCATCTLAFPEGARIFWTKASGATRHLDCEAAKREQEDAAFSRLLARMEGTKGAAGRQRVLTEADKLIASPELRTQLLLEASKLEVDGVLEKVETLKSAIVKRRRLQEALYALRADAVPDEMQAQQVAWLEEALGKLPPAKNGEE